ncbi:MAG: small multi-drug export protein [Eubacteriales bacterium]|nr:small multi-drug export protein [Eubacteriales bacterium]
MIFTELLNHAWHYLLVMLFSMLPIIELKGAIPVGLAFNLGVWETFFAAFVGSCLPAPFLILLIRKLLQWMQNCRFRWLRQFSDYLNNRIRKKSQNKRIRTSAVLGLFLFVAIPLPTTGVWMGSMIAGMLDIRMSHALPAIVVGNLVAGLIILYMSHLVII